MIKLLPAIWLLVAIPANLPAAGSNTAFQPITTTYQTDHDHDGIDDSIEQALAVRFAPEYRFYRRIEEGRLVTPDPLQQAADPTATPRRSFQNNSERYFPTRVDPFLQSPSPTGQSDGIGPPVIYVHVYLYRIIPSWKLARWLIHRGWREEVIVEYWTFYSYDDKGLQGWLDHVGDWEHINIKITRSFDTVGRFLSDGISEAVFYGHGTERVLAADVTTNQCIRMATAGIRVPAKSLLVVDQTHPMVFVSAGTHADYPWPGIWQNLICQGGSPSRIGTYDDLFLGNGKVMAGWRDASLINLGEVDLTGPRDPFHSRDPKTLCRRRQLLDPNLLCDTGLTAESAGSMPSTRWNAQPRYFGSSRDLTGEISSPIAPGFHREWGLFDPIAGYPYTALPENLQGRLPGLDHTLWEDVIKQTAKIPDGLGVLRTSKTFTLDGK